MVGFKFIQVNIYKGKYLDALLEFLKSESPDFISMQEVTTGKLNSTEDERNLFEVIKNELGYSGAYNEDSKLKGFPDSMFGNAVLSRFPVVDTKVLVLRKFRPMTKEEIESDERIWGIIARHVLDLIVNVNGQKIHAMSWHGAWTAPPADTPETLRQAKMVARYLKSLSEPFILGVDMNNTAQSKTAQIIDEVAVNHMKGSGVLQTTHPKIHKIAPRGYLIDYIYSSEHFNLKSLRVPQVTVSDHLPVVAQLEI